MHDIFIRTSYLISTYQESNKISQQLFDRLVTLLVTKNIQNCLSAVIDNSYYSTRKFDNTLELIHIFFNIFKNNNSLITSDNAISILQKLNYISISTTEMLKLFHDNKIYVNDAICQYCINIISNKYCYHKNIHLFYEYVHDKENFPIMLFSKILNLKKISNKQIWYLSEFISNCIKSYSFKPNRKLLTTFVDISKRVDPKHIPYNNVFKGDILIYNSDDLNLNDAKLLLSLKYFNKSEVISCFINKINFDDELITLICSDILNTITELTNIFTSNKITLNVSQLTLLIKSFPFPLFENRCFSAKIITDVIDILTHYLSINGTVNSELFCECCKSDKLAMILLNNGYIPTNEDLTICTENNCSKDILMAISNKIPQQSSQSNDIIHKSILNKNAHSICFAIESNIFPTEEDYHEIFKIVTKIDTIQKLTSNGFDLDILCLENACTISNNDKLIEYIINSGIEPNETCIDNLCNTEFNDNIIKKLIHRKYKFTFKNLKDANCRYRGKRLINDMILIIDY